MKNIKPVTLFGITFNRIEISPVTLNLNEAKSASWKATIYTDDGAPEHAISKDLSLTGDEFETWYNGNDTPDIEAITCEKGVELA